MESVKKHPRKFRRKSGTAAELGKGFQWTHDVRQRPCRKWFALQGHIGKLESGEARIPGACFPAQRARTTLFALPRISGGTRHLQ